MRTPGLAPLGAWHAHSSSQAGHCTRCLPLRRLRDVPDAAGMSFRFLVSTEVELQSLINHRLCDISLVSAWWRSASASGAGRLKERPSPTVTFSRRARRGGEMGLALLPAILL